MTRPKPVGKAPWHRRATAHPWVSLTALGGIVAILWTVGPTVLNFFDRFQTRAEADRKFAWIVVQLDNQSALALRNRVNDCNAKRSDATLTAGEVAPCRQYEQEYEEARQRARESLKRAQELSR